MLLLRIDSVCRFDHTVDRRNKTAHMHSPLQTPLHPVNVDVDDDMLL